ncbi:MAG: PLP-dependent aminotransferase family protein [Alphaproteobacteria bacterium]
MPFDYTALFRPDLPPPAAGRFSGFPEYNFIGGHNDAASVPVPELAAAAAAVLEREGRDLATYGLQSGPQGYRPLRDFIAGALKANAGIACSADDILVTSGSLQALDLVNGVLLAPGDTVILEAASYGGAISRLGRLGVRCVGVEGDADGLRTDTLAETLDALAADGVKPKYIYTIPTVQNPTGTVMSVERRKELLALATQHGVPIFEDDCYADLVWEGERPPSIRSLDDGSRVIYCGSFSKTIAPALRVGYLLADWDVLSRMLAIKTDAGSGAIEQMILGEYLPAHFAPHVARLTRALHGKCQAIVDALAAEFGTDAEFTAPKGGIFIWVTLPEGVDTSALAQAAAAEGVALNPGAEWVADPETGRRSMRLCFGNPSVETIQKGVAKLAEICHRETGFPRRGANVERAGG